MTKETANEAISRIKSMCCDGCSSYRGVLCSACKLDDGMSVIECMENPNERVVTWHPYPEEKPAENTWVIVQYEDNDMFIDEFVEGDFYWNPSLYYSVVAWAYLPEPYKER